MPPGHPPQQVAVCSICSKRSVNFDDKTSSLPASLCTLGVLAVICCSPGVLASAVSAANFGFGFAFGE